ERIEAPRDDDRVFQRHVGALSQERQGRMRSVAHYANPAFGEVVQRFAAQQRPLEWRIDVTDDGLHVLVPGREVAQTFLGRAGLILAAPFAVATASPLLGSLFARIGVGRIPEEIAPPTVLLPLRLPAIAASAPGGKEVT